MCTAISFVGESNYFGRSLDLDVDFAQTPILTPRRFPLAFRRAGTLKEHLAILGTATLRDGCPLYFDAVNEAGLAAAALNFPHLAKYLPPCEEKLNVASFELIPYVLSTCESVAEAAELLEILNVTDDNFSAELPSSPLHWIFSDGVRSAVLECDETGVNVFPNPLGVLTNPPEFPSHVKNWETLAPAFSDRLGAGLPGDYGSESRFVRAAFARERGTSDGGVAQFFHLFDAVTVPRGCVVADSGEYHYTRYTSCMDTRNFAYYYKEYSDTFVRRVRVSRCELDGTELVTPRTSVET